MGDSNITCISEYENFACHPYKAGCIKHLTIIIHRSALYIGTGAVAIALIQVSIIILIFSVYLSS